MAVTLKVNNIEVTVPKGSTILEAAEQAGVFIPTLCHDKRVAPSGACRLCIVEDRRKPGQFLPSCFSPARADMDIVTESPAVLEAVREQLKLILVNHPLECPVCDKAGECRLQDLVVRYGITEAPYQLAQQPRAIDLESPLIERDMTRCILCGRCVRICSELQGRNELEFIGRGYRMSVGTDGNRHLDCDFCGLCISTCPVGALNDKLFKNTTRVWKLEKRETVCSHCGLGCGVELNMEENRIRRVTAPRLPDGKEGLLCVRGRFGWRAFEEHGRPLTPQINDNGRLRNVDWDEALNFTACRISEVHKGYGGESFAALTADLLTTDEAYGYGRFFRTVLCSESVASIQASGYRSIITQLDTILTPKWKMASMSDIMETDILLVLGGGAAELHPVLKPVINSYLKKEGRELIVISSWPDYAYERATLPIAVAPGLFGTFMNDLREALAAPGTRSRSDKARYVVDTCRLARFISILQKEANITVLVVPDLYGRHDARTLMAASLHDRVRGILPLGGRFNSLGAVADGEFFSATGREVDDILADIEAGKIKALYLLGEDPLADCRDPERVRLALQTLDLLICQSPYRTSVVELAHVVLPTALPPEKQGPVLSITGERHHIRPVMRKPDGVRSDGEILQELVRIMGLDEKMFSYDDTVKNPADRYPRSCPSSLPKQTEPIGPLHVDVFSDPRLSVDFPFHLFPIPSLFGDGILARLSPEIEALRNGLVVVMNRDEFEACGFAEKEAVEIQTPYGSAQGHAVSSAKAQKGTLLLRHAAGDRDGLSLLGPGDVVTFASIGKAEGR